MLGLGTVRAQTTKLLWPKGVAVVICPGGGYRTYLLGAPLRPSADVRQGADGLDSNFIRVRGGHDFPGRLRRLVRSAL